MDPDRRGVKLLGKLTGDASDKMELLDAWTLKCSNGAGKFKAAVQAKYEPIESQRIGQIMDNFMYKFKRNPREELMDYDTRFDKEYRTTESRKQPVSSHRSGKPTCTSRRWCYLRKRKH